jgi:signal transduction histidine kinase
VDAATDPKWEVRKEAAVALAECRHHESGAQKALAQLARDENRWVSQAAERAIKRMRSRASRAKEWALTPDAQDPTLHYILKRIREIGLRSMTPARIYELAMEVVEQSYRELAAETAHELRTLLTPFEGYLAELRRYLAPRGTDAKVEHMLGMALDRLHRIQLLTEDLREYSLQNTAVYLPVELAAVIHDAVALGQDAGETGAEQRIAHVIDVPTGLVVDALRERLVRAIANLIANACQAMPESGTLTVRARRAGDDTIAIAITDTGRGMSPTQIEEARLRFSSTRRDEGGTGLGIPIAERIIEHDHGGELSFESVVGEGTTVTLTLPVRRPWMSE